MSKDKFSTWAIIELFGHQQIAGEVNEYTIGSSTWIRVTVPATEKQETFDRFLNPSAIYAINPVDEQIAKMRANKLEVAPVSRWDLPESIREAIKQHQESMTAGSDEDDDLPY